MKKTYLQLPDGSEVELKGYVIPHETQKESDGWSNIVSDNWFTINANDKPLVELPSDFLLLIADMYEQLGNDDAARFYRKQNDIIQQYLKRGE
jgi:hypothetical protein